MNLASTVPLQLLDDIVTKNPSIAEVVFTGHSLGGALAVLTMMLFCEKIRAAPRAGSLRTNAVTFAAPLVGDARFMDSFKAREATARRSTSITSIVLDNDAVPRILIFGPRLAEDALRGAVQAMCGVAGGVAVYAASAALGIFMKSLPAYHPYETYITLCKVQGSGAAKLQENTGDLYRQLLAKIPALSATEMIALHAMSQYRCAICQAFVFTLKHDVTVTR